MCILCHKKGDPRTILTHLASYNHQLTYLQKHFPTAYRHIAPYMVKGYKRNWQNGLLKIVEAIEATFGRLKPIQVENAKYSKDQMYYVEMVAKAKHFSELSGQTFENVVTKEELTRVHEIPKGIVTTTAVISKPMKRKSPSPPVVAKPMKKPKMPAENKSKRRSLSPVSDVSSSDLEDFDVKSPKKPIKYNEIFRRPPVERSQYTKREGNMPWQKSSYRKDRPQPVIERTRDEKVEKMEEYKRLAKAIDNQMEIVLKKHKENPEKHPKYNDEWKKFWNARYKELQAEGKNASTHDFKPEWIECWNKRMLELHKEEIVSSKAALRKRLGLGEEPAPISFRIGERRKAQGASYKPTPTAAQPDNDPEVIVIDDTEEDLVLKGRNRSRSPVKKRDHSPQFRRRSPVRKRSPSPSRQKNSPSPPSYRRRERSPPTRRRDSPLSRRKESLVSSRRESPPSRKKESPKRQLSPLSRRKGSPFYHKAPSPPTRLREDKLSPPRDRFERTRERSEERSRSSRGKSREISWERERERRRDYDEKHWDRPYRGREYPWEHDLHPGFNSNPYAPPKILRDVTRKPVLTPEPPSYSEISEPIEDDGDVNIVAVLRLLTALEEKLGSLGPKVIDLLSQALAMEKKVPNSSEELLDSEMNCVLFETVKEKLKGQLQAGLVDWIQEKAFKTAIRKTASLIHEAGERKKQKEEEMPKKPVVVPGIGKVDKGKIARQIANALIAQGKTDVTQSELEELINAVVGIAEAQKNSSEPLTTASFLEKLAASQPKETKPTIEPKVEPEPKVQPEPKEEKETVHKLEEDIEVSSSSQDKSTINMEGLSDSDLETLLQNFKDLSSDEQVGLINYLKKLEAREPERVEKLRKFVNLSESTDDKDNTGKYSPSTAKIEDFTNKESSEKRNDEIKEDKKDLNNLELISIDSEDEYSFDDVAKAVSQKVIENEKEQKRLEHKNLENKNLDDAKAFITSLMSSLNKTVSQSSTTTTTNSPVVSSVTTTNKEKINLISNIPISSVDVANSLSGITMSMSSLGNILGNVQSLTNKAQAVQQQQERQPELKLNIPIQPLKPSIVPSAPTNSSRNPYNDFDIAGQRDQKSKTVKGQPNKSYDEFNIGPIPQDVKDDVRPQGPSSSRLMDKPLGYSDLPRSSNSPFPERIPQSNTNLPFTNLQRNPIRGTAIQDKQLPLFSNNQFPAKGGPFPDKFRTGGNNFELSGGSRGDLEPRTSDFRAGTSDVRGGVGNFRTSTDYRDAPNNYRDAPSSYRDSPNSYREAPSSYRDAPNSYREAPNSYRDAPNNYRDAPTSYRDAPNDYRDDSNDYRDAPDDYRDALNDYSDAPNDYRDSPNDYRGAPSNYRGGPSNIRGNDFRDARASQGNSKSTVEDSRNKTNDYRGGFGNPRGGQANKMGGNVNYGNRQNSFPPAPRYPQQGNNFNAYNKW
ncbi:uncharacterized protein CG7065-like isoform X2 [Harmonia axyridis]|nr:uncharacterized protein CG7065-like isoform X2 [Harmonia axyridis]